MNVRAEVRKLLLIMTTYYVTSKMTLCEEKKKSSYPCSPSIAPEKLHHVHNLHVTQGQGAVLADSSIAMQIFRERYYFTETRWLLCQQRGNWASR